MAYRVQMFLNEPETDKVIVHVAHQVFQSVDEANTFKQLQERDDFFRGRNDRAYAVISDAESKKPLGISAG